jgi:cysteine desulfurase
MIYLDHAASTPLVPEALSALQKSFAEDFANSASAHPLGKEQNKKMQEIKDAFLKDAKASKLYDFYLTSSATESNNLFIFGVGEVSGMVYSNQKDHPALYQALAERAHRDGLTLTDHLNDLSNLGLLGLSWVNGLDGSRIDVNEVGRRYKEENPKGIFFVDGAQGFGKYELDLSSGLVDGLSVSAHKMGGPKGISGLFLKKSLTLTPLWFGGGHQEGLRPSTVPVSLGLGFLSALEFWQSARATVHSKVVELSSVVRAELADEVEFINDENNRSPYIDLIKIKGISSDILLRTLADKKVYISSSSACSSRIKGDNPSYLALGIDSKFHKNILRVSYGHSTTIEDVKEFCKALKQVLSELSFLIKA